MHRQSNQYTFMFALIVCVICSLALSLVSEGLRSKKEMNVALDVKRNILKAVDLENPLSVKVKVEELLKVYEEKIEEKVVNGNGFIVEGKTPEDIKEGEELYPLYVYNENGKTLAYCFPISGKGLWSTIYGYFALEADASTVRGVTFYKHGETPGLGAEIEKEWFLNNFKKKSVWDEEAQVLVPVEVAKGKVADVIAEAKQKFYVDGISGATMTSKGISAMVKKWLDVYEPFFSEIR